MNTTGGAAGVLAGEGPAPEALPGADAAHVSGAPVHGTCANCGAHLTGAFCHACGQSAHIHRTLVHMLEEFLHGLLHFDARAWRTLPMLAFRPGTLTREVISGRRVRYISPLALFLFSVFLMFFVFSVLGEGEDDPTARPSLGDLEARVIDADASLTEAQLELAEAQRQILAASAAAGAAASGPDDDRLRDIAELEQAVKELAIDKADADTRLSQAKERQRRLELAREDLFRQRAAADVAGDAAALSQAEALLGSVNHALATGSVYPHVEVTSDAGGAMRIIIDPQKADSGGRESLFEQISRLHAEGRLTIETGLPYLDKKISAKLENPELGLYKIETAAYKLSFLLAPLSLPFMAALFLFRRGVTLYDHTVFVLYSLSFVALLLVGVVLVSLAGPWAAGPLALVAVFAPPAHIFFQLRGAYQLGWFSAAWRTLVLLVFAMVVLILFVTLIILLGLTG